VERKFYAHSLPGRPVEEWQPLEEHLKNVAEMAAKFARPFGGDDWALLAGYNHDLGKGTLRWQAYLRHVNEIMDCLATHYRGRTPHALVGAQLLYQHSKDAGKLLAYCIAGHHGGLPNWDDSQEKALKSRLCNEILRTEIAPKVPQIPAQLPFETHLERFGFQIQFFVRMLFSCLVDADFLDTERCLDEERAAWRTNYPKLLELRQSFWGNFNQLRAKAHETKVNRQRELVLYDCLQAAKKDAGLFSLTVPTGGGKTLASMSFALEHAAKHEKHRIIYVIPFTSIIEQNAAVFREMLGGGVLEHHCNFVPDEADWRARLSSENWDAPVVITTNVQFFDSFFASKPSRCRKLHNVANSVIIFDEVQAIPVERLGPCLEVIRELSLNYKVTALLCTATQPAIHFSETFKLGLKDVREIVASVPVLFNELQRTRETFIGVLSEQVLADNLSQYEQVLCVVNFRRQASEVFAALPDPEANIHLSALMYPAHRSRKLADARHRLKNGLPCRVVSTQLIEAGVDVDFPCVFRAASGIDSIAQAAGRCNRNGRSKTPRSVFVFKFNDEPENSYIRQAAQSAQKLFDRYNGALTSPDCVYEYFMDYFWKNQHRMDADGTLDLCRNALRGDIQFKDIAAFAMIKTTTLPVVIAIEEEPKDLIRQLEFVKYPALVLRKLQQYSVQIYPYQLNEIRSWLENIYPGIWVLRSPELYSQDTGFKCTPPGGCAFFG
jgi:CRISPR-associated endonuclease/helicase Cas3